MHHAHAAPAYRHPAMPLHPAQDGGPPQDGAGPIRALCERVLERIIATPACNCFLRYMVLDQEVNRRLYLASTNAAPRRAALLDETERLLRATLDAPAAELADTVRRQRAFVGVPNAEEERMAQITAPVFAPDRPRVSPAEQIATLARRGVTLTAGRKGELHAAPAALLDDADRAMIRDRKAGLLAVLRQSIETF